MKCTPSVKILATPKSLHLQSALSLVSRVTHCKRRSDAAAAAAVTDDDDARRLSCLTTHHCLRAGAVGLVWRMHRWVGLILICLKQLRQTCHACVMLKIA